MQYEPRRGLLFGCLFNVTYWNVRSRNLISYPYPCLLNGGQTLSD